MIRERVHGTERDLDLRAKRARLRSRRHGSRCSTRYLLNAPYMRFFSVAVAACAVYVAASAQADPLPFPDGAQRGRGSQGGGGNGSGSQIRPRPARRQSAPQPSARQLGGAVPIWSPNTTAQFVLLRRPFRLPPSYSVAGTLRATPVPPSRRTL